MNSFIIKIIAVVTMAIDHIGLFFFPNIFAFRVIGRLSFPLFAWLLSNGARHTRSMKMYLARLFILALVSQIPFSLANKFRDATYSDLNVAFTLFLGLAGIAIIKNYKNKFLWLVSSALFALIAYFLKTDYGAFGVITIIGFYIFLENKILLVISQIIIFFVPYFILLEQNSFTIEPIGLISLIFIMFYNGKQGPKAKYLFYVFYPLQYVIIYILQSVFLHR